MASLSNISFCFMLLILCSSHCFARKVIKNDLHPKDNNELRRKLASETSETSVKGDRLSISSMPASGFGSGGGFGDGQGDCHDDPYAPGDPTCGAEPANPVSGPNYPPQSGGWGDAPSCAPQPTNPPPVCAPQPTYQPPACVPQPTNPPPNCSPQPTHPPNCAPQPANTPDCSTQPANPPVVCSPQLFNPPPVVCPPQLFNPPPVVCTPQPSNPPVVCAPQPCNPGNEPGSRMHGHGVNPSHKNLSGKEAQIKPLGKEKQDGKPAQGKEAQVKPLGKEKQDGKPAEGKEAQVKPLEKEKQDMEPANDKQDNESAHEMQDSEPMPPDSLNLPQEQTAEAPMFSYMNDDDDGDSELEM